MHQVEKIFLAYVNKFVHKNPSPQKAKVDEFKEMDARNISNEYSIGDFCYRSNYEYSGEARTVLLDLTDSKTGKYIFGYILEEDQDCSYHRVSLDIMGNHLIDLEKGIVSDLNISDLLQKMQEAHSICKV